MVYTARSYYYGFTRDTVLFNDSAICSQSYKRDVSETEQTPTPPSTEKPAIQKGIVLFPNPATNQVNILSSLGADETGTLTFWNVTGVLSKQIEVKGGNNQTPVSVKDFSNGVYLYKFKSSKQFETVGKLVITR